MTLLVLDPVPQSLSADVSRLIMQESHLHAEQVGFAEADTETQNTSYKRLLMPGGEFCANAVRSLAAYMAFKECPGSPCYKENPVYLIETSGVREPVECTVFRTDREGIFISRARLPLPEAVISMEILHHKTITVYATLVIFPGITHLVADPSVINNKEDFFLEARDQIGRCLNKNENCAEQDMLRQPRNSLSGPAQYKALGIMYYNYTESYLEPLVWVRETDTLVWERGCGSGTAAVGAAIAAKQKTSISRKIKQPGGIMEVNASWKSRAVAELILSGEVQIVAEGTAYL